MTDRQLQILGAVVEEYALTCEPVGSKAIVTKYPVDVSSATVRNEMAELEEMGYLIQPHTSSGRIPSDLGYRTYVQHLLGKLPSVQHNKSQMKVQKALNQSFDDALQLLQQVALTLADYTGYPALTLSPRADYLTIEQIHFIELAPRRLILLMALSEGVLQDKQIWTDIVIPSYVINDFNFLLEQFTGERLADLDPGALMHLAALAGFPRSIAKQLTQSILDTAEEAVDYVLYLEGLGKIFKQPEFQDAERAVELMDLLDSEQLLTHYLAANLNEPGDYFIRIGSDLNRSELEDCTLLGMRYQFDSGGRGYLAILGPRRMAYRKVIPRVTFVREVLNNILHRKSSSEDSKKGGSSEEG